MSAPICDFVKRYAESDPLRLHMPGHKGEGVLGVESLDITEIDGADELFSANGVIAESEKNAGELFGAKTFYSAGGSTLCIQAMLHLVSLYAAESGKKAVVLAARNAHKAFVNASALLGIEVRWLFSSGSETYHSCPVSLQQLEKELDSNEKVTAVYLTSPDYLGNTADIASISALCKKKKVLLCVDNAHGAYLKFLPQSKHPIDLGADMCCDSAHKTLPVLTGGAYLHVSRFAPRLFGEQAKSSLSLFASSSPSYLILQSLDAANDRMAKFKEELTEFLPSVEKTKRQLFEHGFSLLETEPLKLTIMTKSYGYTGDAFASLLGQSVIYVEFHDPDFVVMMLSPLMGESGLERLKTALFKIERKERLNVSFPALPRPERVLTAREAVFEPSEVLPAEKCVGRVCAQTAISCPPAIPLVVCGERIDENVIENFRYYNVKTCKVTRE